MISRTESAVSAESIKFNTRTQRIISGVLNGALWVFAVLLGRPVFSIVVGALIVLSIDELSTLFRWRGAAINRQVAMLAGAFLAVVTYFAGVPGLLAGLTLSLMALMGRQAIQGLRFSETGLTMGIVSYVGGLLAFLILVSGLKNGQAAALIVLMGTWASDVAAYFGGGFVGKSPLAPKLSANKTWEGAAFGLIAPVTIVGIAGTIPWFGLTSGDPVTGLIKGIVIGAFIGVAAPIGDLVESRLKRELNVKDTGDILPGHGGFLDRLDSIMFTSVGVYYLLHLFAALKI